MNILSIHLQQKERDRKKIMTKKELIEKIELVENDVTLEERVYDFDIILALFQNSRPADAMKLATPEQQHMLIEAFAYHCRFAEIAKYIKAETWKEDAYRILASSANSRNFGNISDYIDTFKPYVKYINCKEVCLTALEKLQASRTIDAEYYSAHWILRLILTAAPMGES